MLYPILQLVHHFSNLVDGERIGEVTAREQHGNHRRVHQLGSLVATGLAKTCCNELLLGRYHAAGLAQLFDAVLLLLVEPVLESSKILRAQLGVELFVVELPLPTSLGVRPPVRLQKYKKQYKTENF